MQASLSVCGNPLSFFNNLFFWGGGGGIFNPPLHPLYDCLSLHICIHNIQPVPTRYAPEFYCPIPEADWNYFLGVYGGGPVVRKDEFIKITGAQQEMDASLKRMPE